VTDAVNAANADTNPSNYYTIDVSPGTYKDDTPTVMRPMTIINSNYSAGQKVVLQATKNVANKKGIIVTFASLTVDGLTLTGAKTLNGSGGNAAGIRDENQDNPGTLVVRNSIFVANQQGILTDGNPAETISITNSKFINNGNGTIHGGSPFCCQHGIYISIASSLSVTGSMFCGQLVGHDIKSRALLTNISNNVLFDAAVPSTNPDGCNAGSTSFAIDAPNGGDLTISGNTITQGPKTASSVMVAYGEEGLKYNSNSVSVSTNMFTSTGVSNSIGIYDPPCIPVSLAADNTFAGVTTPVSPAQCAVTQ
jgi:hypothetical protein